MLLNPAFTHQVSTLGYKSEDKFPDALCNIQDDRFIACHSDFDNVPIDEFIVNKKTMKFERIDPGGFLFAKPEYAGPAAIETGSCSQID
jgi:hypothetical protein